MAIISQEKKDSLAAAIGDVSAALGALGSAYRNLVGAYEVASREAFVADQAGNFASAVGPDRFNEDIVGAMNANGLSPLIARLAMHGANHRNVVEDLQAAFARRLASV